MTISSMSIEELIGKVLGSQQGDFLRQALVALVREVMEAEVRRLTGAAHGERSSERHNHRNGYRLRDWDTRLGRLALPIPRLRTGSYFPSFLEPRRRAEQALVAVIQEAYIQGVSTRKVEDLVQTLGIPTLSKSEVSRICQALDAQVAAFRQRPLGAFPYLWLDAKYVKVRVDGHVVNEAVVVAYGVNADGNREVVGFAVGASESAPFWTEFLRGLVGRGLAGVRLVISDGHEGLKQAIATVLTGASWQRCTVHFQRNVQSKVPKNAQDMIRAAVGTVFQQPSRQAAQQCLAEVIATLAKPYPALVQLLQTAEEDVLAFYAFPKAHWRQLRSTNPLERLNKEIARRADVVGIFPNDQAVLRLIGMVLIEQHEEWQVGRRYFSEQSMAQLYTPLLELPAQQAVPEVVSLPAAILV